MSQLQPPKPNQRRSRRQPAKKSVKAACFKGSMGLGANLALSVLDVSETGVRLLVKADLPPGQEVEIDLESPGSQKVKALARVVWSVPAEDGTFRVGARFDKGLSYAALQALSRP
jgi:hypothetical protein